MRLLVTGSAGMLGLAVMRAGDRAGHELVGLPRAELDVTDVAAVGEAFERITPDAVINCAAWTNVDGAETHGEQAYAVNADGAGNLARAAARAGVPLLQLSTDYVFDGIARVDAVGEARPYLESDPTAPLSVYGESKLVGERQVLEASRAHAVVRSSWLFGLGGQNFAATMLGLAAEPETSQANGGARVAASVKVVTDQTGCPTWTGHLAPALIGLLEREVTGVVHLAGGGFVSWNGFAKEIFRQAEVDCAVHDRRPQNKPGTAPRPAWSALDSEREDVIPLPPWEDGLAGFLAARAGMMRA